MEGIWTRILPSAKMHDFFAKSLLEWCYDNLSSIEVKVMNGNWPTMFAIAVWWGWKWRCGNVFGRNRTCRDRVQFVRKQVEEVNCFNLKETEKHSLGVRVERLIKWEWPSIGWYKVNTDGASRGNPRSATARGVLRDGDGQWSRGFALNLGRCSAPLPELWGVYYGLCIAWEKQVRQVELEIDSEAVVGFLRTGIVESHPLSFLVRLCHGLISRDWIVRISHVYREANCLADSLANYAFSLPLGIHVFDVVPVVVESIWQDDVSGLAKARHVYL